MMKNDEIYLMTRKAGIRRSGLFLGRNNCILEAQLVYYMPLNREVGLLHIAEQVGLVILYR